MLSEEEKKEILEDALSEKRRKAFEEADRRAEEFVRKYRPRLTVDGVIAFLMNAQKVTGPFPISREVPHPPLRWIVIMHCIIKY